MLSLVAFLSSAGAQQDHWHQYRSFGGQNTTGDIKTIISDIRYVYVLSANSGARYDKLKDEWQHSFPAILPDGNYQFAALDIFTDDLYFVYYSRILPYHLASSMQYPYIDFPAGIRQLAFDARGIWAKTVDGIYFCDRFGSFPQKTSIAPENLSWSGPVDINSLKKDPSLYFVAQPVWDSWAGMHGLTAYAKDQNSNCVWAAYSGLGLWRYDLTTNLREQISKGGLASADVRDIVVHSRTVGMAGYGGATFVETDTDQWLPLVKLFNVDLSASSLNCLAFDEKKIFIGTDRGVLMIDKGDDFAVTVGGQEEFSGRRILSLLLLSEGLWIGTADGLDFYPANHSRAKVEKTTLRGISINKMAADDNYIYLATDRGAVMLGRADSVKIVRYDTSSPAEIDGPIVSVVADGRFVFWLAPDMLMIYDKNDRLWQKYTRAGNYVAGIATCMTSDDTNYWIGTDKGLVRFEKATNIWKVYRKEDGLLDENITSLASLNGVLWIGGTSGLTRFEWQKNDRSR